MSTKKSKIEHLIQEYLIDEGILKERSPDPKSELDFGFIFTFPPGPGPNSQRMSVFKPKNKNYIIVAIRTEISKSQINELNSGKDNKIFQFFSDLRKFLLIKEVYFRINAKNYRFEIHKQFFPDRDEYISKNSFYEGIQKVYYCFFYASILLSEHCSGKEIPSKTFGPEFDLSLYS